MKAGDTFVASDPRLENHLWVVISDPDVNSNEVLIVNVTTYTSDQEGACILQPGDPPFIKRKSCIYYRGAQLNPDWQLERLLSNGSLKHKEPVTPDILARIREGAGQSHWIREECRKILELQGHIDAS